MPFMTYPQKSQSLISATFYTSEATQCAQKKSKTKLLLLFWVLGIESKALKILSKHSTQLSSQSTPPYSPFVNQQAPSKTVLNIVMQPKLTTAPKCLALQAYPSCQVPLSSSSFSSLLCFILRQSLMQPRLVWNSQWGHRSTFNSQ